MKRILCTALAMLCVVCLAFSITGCGGKGSAEVTADSWSVYDTTIAESSNKPAGNTVGEVAESAAVSASYFDDACFVGDSVSLMLSRYAASGCLGKAQFFTSGSLGSSNALWEVSAESVHPSYQGVKMLIEDCVQKSGASKVYVMLGMNDIGLYGVDESVKNFETLMDKILEKSPDAKIIVQSMTPMTSTSTIAGNNLNNDNIKVYNDKLRTLCEEREWAFVNVGSVMYDEDGTCLKREYCSDPDGMGVHFTEVGCEMWVDYLKTHTP